LPSDPALAARQAELFTQLGITAVPEPALSLPA
jgi:hypothetical protein